MQLKSRKACLIVINGVDIKPSVHPFSTEDYNAVKDHPDFRYLIAEGQFELDEAEPEDAEAPKTLEEMSVKELRKYADDNGLVVEDGLKKSELLEYIKMVS